MKKKLLLLLFMCLAINVKAECSYGDIARQKAFVSNITYTYDYKIIESVAYFDVYLYNVPSGIYIKNSSTGEVYNNFADGQISLKNLYINKLSLGFYSSTCNDGYLGVRYINFPQYNAYSTDNLCTGIEDYELCKKWKALNISYDKFVSRVLKYKETLIPEPIEKNITHKKSFGLSLIDFYVNYYYFILGGIIVILLPIIIVLKKKTNIDLKI